MRLSKPLAALDCHEEVRQGNIHFAGEHCSVNFRGFMEGGARTGLNAAREVLAELS
jgi:monoamine oxidase